MVPAEMEDEMGNSALLRDWARLGRVFWNDDVLAMPSLITRRKLCVARRIVARCGDAAITLAPDIPKNMADAIVSGAHDAGQMVIPFTDRGLFDRLPTEPQDLIRVVKKYGLDRKENRPEQGR